MKLLSVLRFAVRTAALLALVLVALVWWGLREAASEPLRRETGLTLAGISPERAPYRVALLSDIHLGNRAMPAERLDRIVTAVNAAQPDLIVIVGDFVNGYDGHLDSDPRVLTTALARLRAPDGVVATLGNHDHWTAPEQVRSALESAGITVLANQPLQRGPLMLLGLDDARSGHAEVAATLAAVPQGSQLPLVAMTHSSDLVSKLPATVPLLLAGHTHCGQVVFPVIGSLAQIIGRIRDGQPFFIERYMCGIVRDPGRTVVTTGGLGSGTLPLRIGAPPDWWLLSLSAPKDR